MDDLYGEFTDDAGTPHSAAHTTGTPHSPGSVSRHRRNKQKEKSKALKSTFDFLKRKLTGQFSALHQAAYEGDAEAAKRYLLTGRLGINKPDKAGWTALHIAVDTGQTEVVNVLLQWNADVNVAEEDGLTPLHQAAEKGNLEVVYALIQYNAQLDVKDKTEGETALIKAVKNHQHWVCKALLEGGASANEPRKDMLTPLHFAAAIGRSDIVKILLEYGANVSAVDKDNWTPLHHAAKEGQYLVVKDLRGAGAVVNAKAERETTPLHLAASWERIEMCIELLNEGADPSIPCGQGQRLSYEVTRNKQLKQILKDAMNGTIPPPVRHNHSPPTGPATPPSQERPIPPPNRSHEIGVPVDMEAAKRQLSPQRNLRVHVASMAPGGQQVSPQRHPGQDSALMTYHAPSQYGAVSVSPQQINAPVSAHAVIDNHMDTQHLKPSLSDGPSGSKAVYTVPVHARYQSRDGHIVPEMPPEMVPDARARHARGAGEHLHADMVRGAGKYHPHEHVKPDDMALRSRNVKGGAMEGDDGTHNVEALHQKDLEIEKLRLELQNLQAMQAQSAHMSMMETMRMGYGGAEVRRYTFKEISEATEDFSARLLIGEGGFGHVYRGSIKGLEVAIKVLRENSLQGETEFRREVDVLSRVHHPNIVMLLGLCTERPCLIYEMMKGMSLEDRLARHGHQAPLPWYTRVRIALESARALQYLHAQEPQPILHRDFKPANVLLDAHDTAKLGDVGMARFGAEMSGFKGGSVKTYVQDSIPVGTMAYVDPEYIQTGKYRPASDVFSFGVTLLQIITGCVDPRGIIETVDEAVEKGNPMSILDKYAGNWPYDIAEELILLALQCVEQRARKRPSLEEGVLGKLSKLTERIQAESSRTEHSSRPKEQYMPAMLKCPITRKIMADPVVAGDGFTYERAAIVAWLRQSGRSPMTQQPLSPEQLVPNQQVALAIMKYRKRPPGGGGGDARRTHRREDRGVGAGGRGYPADAAYDKGMRAKAEGHGQGGAGGVEGWDAQYAAQQQYRMQQQQAQYQQYLEQQQAMAGGAAAGYPAAVEGEGVEGGEAVDDGAAGHRGLREDVLARMAAHGGGSGGEYDAGQRKKGYGVDPQQLQQMYDKLGHHDRRHGVIPDIMPDDAAAPHAAPRVKGEVSPKAAAHAVREHKAGHVHQARAAVNLPDHEVMEATAKEGDVAEQPVPSKAHAGSHAKPGKRSKQPPRESAAVEQGSGGAPDPSTLLQEGMQQI